MLLTFNDFALEYKAFDSRLAISLPDLIKDNDAFPGRFPLAPSLSWCGKYTYDPMSPESAPNKTGCYLNLEERDKSVLAAVVGGYYVVVKPPP